MHKGAFCLFPFQWTYYCHSSKSTGKETGKTHLCALNFKNWMFSISIFKKKPNSYILFLTLPWKMYRGNGWTIIQIQCDFRIGSLHYLFLQKKKCFSFSTLKNGLLWNELNYSKNSMFSIIILTKKTRSRYSFMLRVISFAF